MSNHPDGLLDVALLRRLAGEQPFARGEACFADGCVRQFQAAADRASGRVEGTRAYRVKLWRSRGEFQFSCTCAMGQEQTFCEHGVAVGLAWLAAAGEPAPAPTEGTRGTRTPEEEEARAKIAHHLFQVPRERLFALILEATDYDDILRRRLLLEAAGVARAERTRRAVPAPDLEAYRRLLREAIATADYVDYDAMPDYVQGVQEAIAPLGDLLRDGHAAAVVELTEHALVELDKVSDLIDGSDGSLNAVYDDLQRYHLEGCEVARPPARPLAERLLGYEVEGGMGVFNNAINTYADVLGPDGARHWRQRLVEAWSRLPPAHAAGPRDDIDHRRFQLRALMERLAASEQDDDLLLAIRERDLASAFDYLSLAELHAARGQDEAALTRAEEGLRLFATSEDAAGLRDFLVAACERTGRHERVRELLWEELARTGDPAAYRRLREQCLRGEPGLWPAWRSRALDDLRERLLREKTATNHRVRSHPPDGSVLVEILLDEDQDEPAWHEAVAHGCRADLWIRLAVRRETSHPADALGVYQARLEPTIAAGGTTAYREAIGLLDKIRTLLDGLGRGGDYASYRDEVRAAHRGRRGFLKLLDADR